MSPHFFHSTWVESGLVDCVEFVLLVVSPDEQAARTRARAMVSAGATRVEGEPVDLMVEQAKAGQGALRGFCRVG